MFRAPRTCLAAILAGTALLVATPALAGGHAVVANILDGTATILDTSCRTNADPPCATVLATVPVGTQPYGVAAHPDGTLAYVTNSHDDTVSVIAVGSGQVVATVPVGSLPYGVAVDGVTGNVYVSALAGHTLTVIDAAHVVTATIAIDNPHGIAVSPDGARVYVGNYYQSAMTAIDAATRQVVGQVDVGPIPVGIAVHPSGSPVYVASFTDARLRAVDAASLAVVGEAVVGTGAAGVALDPIGSRAFVVNSDENTVSVVRTSDMVVVATIPVGSRPIGIAMHPDGGTVHVANSADNNVSVIDTAALAVVDIVPVGNGPFSHGAFIAATSDPAAQLRALRDTLAGLGIDSGLATSLDSFLRQASEALAQPDGTGPACARLQHFMLSVSQARRTRRLPAAEATLLQRDADAIRVALGCNEATATQEARPIAIPLRTPGEPGTRERATMRQRVEAKEGKASRRVD
jgi:YVTN family beta-propeller protein